MSEATGAAYDVVVLAGGTGERLGGTDKALLKREGRTLIDRLLGEVADARQVAVAGPVRPTERPVLWAHEEPPGGGPAAGVQAGLDVLQVGGAQPLPTLVVAVDMAFVDTHTVTRLLTAMERARGSGEAGEVDGAVLLGRDGRRQLCLVLGPEAAVRLRQVDVEAATGMPLHRLLGGLDLAEIPAQGTEDVDVDTPEDLSQLDRSPRGPHRD